MKLPLKNTEPLKRKKMALKGWKKKYRKGVLAWSKKQGSFWQGIYIYHNRQWEVEIIDFNDNKVTSPVILDTSYFKTKSQALAYARSYMRKH